MTSRLQNAYHKSVCIMYGLMPLMNLAIASLFRNGVSIDKYRMFAVSVSLNSWYQTAKMFYVKAYKTNTWTSFCFGCKTKKANVSVLKMVTLICPDESFVRKRLLFSACEIIDMFVTC